VPHVLVEFFEGERPIVERARQAEAVLDQRLLPCAIPAVHPADLRHGHVALVDDEQPVPPEILEQRGGRHTGIPLGEVPRDVGLGLIVVEVAHEVLDRVVREQGLELAEELGRQGLVVGHHQRGAVVGLDDVGDGEGLPGAGGAEQHLVGQAVPQPLGQLRDGGGLVARGLHVGGEAEGRHRAPGRAGRHDPI
jgi:hypothetical protein